MTSIQLIACIGMVTGFFILLRLSPMEFTDGPAGPKASRMRSTNSPTARRNLFCAVRSPTLRTSSK